MLNFKKSTITSIHAESKQLLSSTREHIEKEHAKVTPDNDRLEGLKELRTLAEDLVSRTKVKKLYPRISNRADGLSLSYELLSRIDYLADKWGSHY